MTFSSDLHGLMGNPALALLQASVHGILQVDLIPNLDLVCSILQPKRTP